MESGLDNGKGHGHISKLPNELLRDILLHIPTFDLLHKYRLVSKHWNRIASLVCRQRHVKFNGWKYCTQTSDLVKDFTNVLLDKDSHQNRGPILANPWSTVEFIPWMGQDHELSSLHLATQFGRSIRSLTITLSTYQLDLFLYTVSVMPYLQVIHVTLLNPNSTLICSDSPPEDKSSLVGYNRSILGTSISVPCLKYLQIEYITMTSRFAVDLIELLVSGVKLRTLDIRCSDCHFYAHEPETEFQRLSTLITTSKIQFISLSLVYPGLHNRWVPLTCHKYWNIQNLEVTWFKSMSINNNHFRNLELFISNCIGLKRLELIGFHDDMSRRGHDLDALLNVPRLPNLRTLVISLDDPDSVEVTLNPETTNLLFRPAPRNLPNLEEIQFRSYDQMHLDVGHLTFPGVKYLEVGISNGDIEDLRPVFPSLIQLTIILDSCHSLSRFLNIVHYPEELVIKIITNEDINDILCKSFHVKPDLKGVKKLSLEVIYDAFGNLIEDCCAILFNSLPPLYLKLGHARLSESCISALRHHHRGFELM